MTFRIYGAPTGGSPQFSESQSLDVYNGYFSTQLGSTALLTADLSGGLTASSGTFTVAASGGDGSSDYLFKRISLVWKP